MAKETFDASPRQTVTSLRAPMLYVHAAFDDEFLRAPNDEDVALLVSIGEVARMQPTLRIQRRRGSGCVLVVSLHHAGAADQHFTGFEGGQILAFSSDDPQLKAPRQAGRVNFVHAAGTGFEKTLPPSELPVAWMRGN